MLRDVVDYYSREEVAKAIVAHAKDREVACAFPDGGYDKRPNILQFPADVVQLAKRGISSFHVSVERWSNPMALSAERQYDALRKGWDLLIDIDSKIGIDESRIAALHICAFLERHGVTHYGVKFSGRRGFHVIVPWELFPHEVDYVPLRTRYPEMPRLIVDFMREKIAADLMHELIREKGAKELIKALPEPPSSLSPYHFVEVERNWGARHMFRAPYSLNEKTWLASVPLTKHELRSFDPQDAAPGRVVIRPFADGGAPGEAESLVGEVLDWHALKKKEEQKRPQKQRVRTNEKVPEEYFPPCILLILNGVHDGRKRSLFTLAHFLRRMNWTDADIEARVLAWNDRNPNPLPQSTILSTLRWAAANQLNPGNCDNDQFYGSIGICKPDEICTWGGSAITIKNPMNYPFRKLWLKQPRTHECDTCKKSFPTFGHLERHRSRAHPSTLQAG